LIERKHLIEENEWHLDQLSGLSKNCHTLETENNLIHTGIQQASKEKQQLENDHKTALANIQSSMKIVEESLTKRNEKY